MTNLKKLPMFVLKETGWQTFLCPGTLVAQMWPEAPRKPLSLLHGTWHTRKEPSWWRGTDRGMAHPKWATRQWRTDNASVTHQRCFSVAGQQCFQGEIMNKRGKCQKKLINGATLKWSWSCCHPRGTALHISCLKPQNVRTRQDDLWTGPKNCLQIQQESRCYDYWADSYQTES